MAFGVSDILDLSRRYDFTYSMTQFLSDRYGIKRTENLLSALKKPVKNYGLRINTLKTSQSEIIDYLKNNKIEVKPDKNFDDIIYFTIKGPYQVTVTDKQVIADKFRR
jgi:16S rRNA C967 or C1407 C5-methylase (RsmB/RsmF family)